MPPYTSAEFDLAHAYRGIPLRQPLPIPATVIACLAAQARAHGGDPFVTEVAAGGEAETLSYGEAEARSRRTASWLRGELQAGPGAVVGLLARNDAASVVAILGLLRAGCAVLMLNPADPPGRLRQQAEALGARAVLRVPSVAPDVLPEAVPVPGTAGLPPAGEADPPLDPGADALFFGTSGSTAASKLVAQSHYSAAVNAEAMRRHHGLARGDRLLACLPIHHVNCLHFTLFGTLAAGAHVFLAHGFDPFGYPRLLERCRPRIASVVPSILEGLLAAWRAPRLPAGFDYFVSAAAPLTARTAREVEDQLRTRVMQGYGLTETTNFSTTMPPGLPCDAYRRLMLEAEIPSVGVALYGNEVAVLTPGGAPAAPGEVGEICMRGHSVMTRYAGNPQATAEAFRHGWFHSQDLGFEVEEGGRRFFVITGRTKNIAKVGGESVSLDEMDRVLRAVPRVADAGCVAMPHRLLGEEIVAAVVCAEDVGDAELRAHLRAVFAAAALPRRIVRVGVLPRTPTGKLLRAELARQLESGV
ncbi:MAG TPA: class I adenylate-forming enzyme family protein [Longimicrobium sp.]|nr:class I adenylate-forming enzyme family protein [Longimicrobium sp.]